MPEVAHRPKVLFVCSRNLSRSLTAERMFAGSPFYDVKSRGLAPQARIRLTEADLRWADQVYVMEKDHQDRIRERFRAAAEGKRIVCLHIDDVYEPMAPELVAVLRDRLAPHLEV
jgi:predicted protein tyrosine phosphatase